MPYERTVKMPAIIVNDYTWRQTPEAIIISTQLSGHPRNVDLFAIDNYIKVRNKRLDAMRQVFVMMIIIIWYIGCKNQASYPPFILELFLWEAILEEESECTVDEKSAVFTLKKAEMGLEWPTLVTENLDKDTKRARRCRAFELARLSAEKLAKSRSGEMHASEMSHFILRSPSVLLLYIQRNVRHYRNGQCGHRSNLIQRFSIK